MELEKYKVEKQFFCLCCKTNIRVPSFPKNMKEVLKEMIASNQTTASINLVKQTTNLNSQEA